MALACIYVAYNTKNRYFCNIGFKNKAANKKHTSISEQNGLKKESC